MNKTNIENRNQEYVANRKKFYSLSLEQLDSPEAYVLEKKIWGCFEEYEDFVPGSHIELRKQTLLAKK